MSHAELIKRIREFLCTASQNEVYSAIEIASALDENLLTVKAALSHMVGSELISSHKLLSGVTVYVRVNSFIARKIVPLLAGTPEWIVETFEGRLICWCPSEFDARIITDALRRS